MEFYNPDKKYKSNNHLTYACHYHVIFCTKYRRHLIFGGIEMRLKEILTETADMYSFEIIDMETMPDHVHLLIDCNPKFGIMECVRKLKGRSSRLLREEFKELTTRVPTVWTRSCFISTVGSVSLDVVKKYIENQKNV